MTTLITTLMTTAITTDYNSDDNLDYNFDDNISLPGIAGYVLSDKLRFPDNTTAADHCVVRPYPLARCRPEGRPLAHKKTHRLGVKTASTIERQCAPRLARLGSVRETHPAAAPPQ